MGSPANLTLGTSTGACAVDATEYLHALQEEKGKIEAFKRELPLCMHLIDQAIESARQRVTDDNCSADSKKHTSSSAPVLENFMPLKRRWERHHVAKSEEEDQEEDEDHKEAVVVGRPAWMGEAHLWTQQQQHHHHHHHSHQDSQGGARSSSRLLLSSKHRQGGAFVPFNRDRQQLSSPPFSPPPNSTPEAAAPGHTDGDNNSDMVGSVDVTRSRERSSSDVRAQRVSMDHTRTSGAAQPPRKARRCWSPELHRRFVNALQQLGGSQVATTKQIRELMKVDGLTNDEVKSHLQKYRLHTRPPRPSPTSPPPMVILGWVPPECGVTQPAATTHVLQDQYKSTASAQPQMRSPPDHSKKHHLSPASQTSSLRRPSSGRGESPHSSTDSYLDSDSDSEEHDQEIKCSTSTSHETSQQHIEEVSNGYKCDQQALRESKGSSTRLADIDDTTVTKAVKLQTLRKTRAAA